MNTFMNTFMKSTLILLAASSMASVAMASPGDGLYGTVSMAQARVSSLESQLEKMGVNVANGVDQQYGLTLNDKAQFLETRVQDLQFQLNELKQE